MRQYAASPIIQKLTEDRKYYFSIEWADSFYSTVWNIDTAQGFGLDIWGRIVVVPRLLTVDEPAEWFGFDEATDAQPFNQAPFWNGAGVTSTYELSDPAYRRLILMKAMTNITDCSIPSLNRSLRSIFSDRGAAYVLDDGNMRMSIVCEFELEPVDISIILGSGAFARPAGVLINAIQTYDRYTTFGFAEGNGQAFDHGTFLSDSGIIIYGN